MSYEIVQKPTFLNQLLGLPSKEISHILSKVRLLEESPAPDAKNKKRLVGYKGNVYRIRSGDYRIVYTFGPGWVSLLGVDNRADVYRGEKLSAEGPEFEIGELKGIEDILQIDRPADRATGKGTSTKSTEDYLPAQITRDLLARLRVSEDHFPALGTCKTYDDLFAADVPESVRTRVFDVITSPDYDRVMQQPDYLTGDVSDLLRFAEGELVGFLLRLDPEQEKYVDWAVNGSGPTLVKGGPGTGKSTIALYRVRSLIQALRRSGVEQPKVLFTTYTNALVASSEQLLRRLLGDDYACVTVRTADSLVMEIVSFRGVQPRLADSGTLRAVLKDALGSAQFEGNALQRRAQAQSIERLSPDYLLEEIETVIVARELPSLEKYLETPRAGRRVRLNATQRAAVWKVHEALSRILDRRGLTTWHRLRRRAVETVRDGHWAQLFDGVLVDEAQDLDPTVIRLLVTLCRGLERLFVTADANQSIYGSSFRWADVHADLRFAGRTGVLRANYRSTKEIGQAAYSYLQNSGLDDLEEGQTYMLSWPQPAVRAVEGTHDEIHLLSRFLPGAAKEFRLGVGACAVLVPSEDAGKRIAARLVDQGLDAVFMPGRTLDLEKSAIKVITLKSAKGLEFPVVALAGFLEGPVPGIPNSREPEEIEESLRRERRTMYVAMTRAMRALLVTVPEDTQSPLLVGFDNAHWNTEPGDRLA